MPLTVGNTYTRVEVQEVIGEPSPSHQGKWGTGYTEHNGEFHIFANIGGAGRTGHDYPNEWDGDVLHWCAKTGTHRDQPAMKRLLSEGTTSHIFTRHHDRDPFTYHGVATPTRKRSDDADLGVRGRSAIAAPDRFEAIPSSCPSHRLPDRADDGQ